MDIPPSKDTQYCLVGGAQTPVISGVELKIDLKPIERQIDLLNKNSMVINSSIEEIAKCHENLEGIEHLLYEIATNGVNIHIQSKIDFPEIKVNLPEFPKIQSHFHLKYPSVFAVTSIVASALGSLITWILIKYL
jgi:hypothetical protein